MLGEHLEREDQTHPWMAHRVVRWMCVLTGVLIRRAIQPTIAAMLCRSPRRRAASTVRRGH